MINETSFVMAIALASSVIAPLISVIICCITVTVVRLFMFV
jgi:hypothetical protein